MKTLLPLLLPFSAFAQAPALQDARVHTNMIPVVQSSTTNIALKILGAAQQVTTVAALANLRGDTGPAVAVVQDADRGGIFLWSASGSTNTTTIYAGSSGVWIRQYSGPVLSKWAGVPTDGVTDAAPSIRTLLSESTNILFTPGDYAVNVSTNNVFGTDIVVHSLKPTTGTTLTFDRANFSLLGDKSVFVDLADLTLGASWTLVGDDLSKAGAGTDTVTLVRTGNQDYARYYAEFVVSGTIGSGFTISDSNGGSTSYTTTGVKSYFGTTSSSGNFTLTITPTASFTGTIGDLTIERVSQYYMWYVKPGVSNVVFQGTGTWTGWRWDNYTDMVNAHLLRSHNTSVNVRVSGLTFKDSCTGVGLSGTGHIIEDCRFENTENAAVAITDAAHQIVRRCVFYNNFPSPYNTSSPSGLDVEPNSSTVQMNNITVENCTFDTGWRGITFQKGGATFSPTLLTARNNIFTNISYIGITISGVNDVTVSGNRFDGNGASTTYPAPNTGTTIANNSSLFISSVSGVTVNGNVFKASASALEEGILSSTGVTNAVFTGNIVDAGYGGKIGNGTAAVILSGTDPVWSGNTILNAPYYGVQLVGGSGAVISGNTFTNTARAAITTSSTATRALISGNRIVDGSATTANFGAIDLTSGASDFLIEGNTFGRTSTSTMMQYCIRVASGATAPITVSDNNFNGAYSVYPIVDQNSTPVTIWTGRMPETPIESGRNVGVGSRVEYGGRWYQKRSTTDTDWVMDDPLLRSTVTTQRASLDDSTDIVSGDVGSMNTTGWPTITGWTDNLGSFTYGGGASGSISSSTVANIAVPGRTVTLTVTFSGTRVCNSGSTLTFSVGGNLIKTFSSNPGASEVFSGQSGTSGGNITIVGTKNAGNLDVTIDAITVTVHAGGDWLHRHTYSAGSLVVSAASGGYADISASGTFGATANSKVVTIGLSDQTASTVPVAIWSGTTSANAKDWILTGRLSASSPAASTTKLAFRGKLEADGEAVVVDTAYDQSAVGGFTWPTAGYIFIGANADGADADVTVNESSVAVKP